MYLLQWIVILASMYFGFIGLKHAQKLKQANCVQRRCRQSFKEKLLFWVFASTRRLQILSLILLIISLSLLIFFDGIGRGIVEFFTFSAVMLFLLILTGACSPLKNGFVKKPS